MKWPRGKYNGKRIAGFKITFQFNILVWYYAIYCWAGIPSIHVGPIHILIETVYGIGE